MELGEFEEAAQYLKRALEIVKAQTKDSGFELAVTHTNLGNCLIRLGEDRRGEAAAHLQEAVEIFRGRGLFDTHFAAAVMGQGELCELAGDDQEALYKYVRGMESIRNNFGYTDFYYRVKDRYDLVKRKLEESGEAYRDPLSMKGMDICREYYSKVVFPSFSEKFPGLVDRVAMGLVGMGSDCFGLDDELSRDHDWGPDVCIWIREEDLGKYRAELDSWYESLAPEFMGFSRSVSAAGAGRRGILGFESFVRGLEEAGSDCEYRYAGRGETFYFLASGGEVFHDPSGMFEDLRRIATYSRGCGLSFLAYDCRRFSQCLQYNLRRVLLRGDELAAELVLAAGLRHTLHMVHAINSRFAPHEKWLASSAERLPLVSGASSMLKELVSEFSRIRSERITERDLGAMNAVVARMAQALAEGMVRAGYLREDFDTSTGIYMEDIAMDLEKEALFESMSHEELTEYIVKIEFETFDKVINEGGRAECQDNWDTFRIMRTSQYILWEDEMLRQYIRDFEAIVRSGGNPIAEKYARMEESTAPDRWEELKKVYPPRDEETRRIIEAIVAIQVGWMEEFAASHPAIAGTARVIHTSEDTPFNTSYETYLRGELSTYSPDMLSMYGAFVAGIAGEGKNLAFMTMEQTVLMYGYSGLDDAEKKLG